MSEEHFYTSEHIDRAAAQRRDEAWVNERLSADSTLFVPVWRDKSFVDRAEAAGDTEYRLSGRPDAPAAPDRRLKAVFLRPDEAMPLLDGHRRAVLLGDSGPHTYFALDDYRKAIVAYNSAANRYPRDPQVLLAYLQMANCNDRLGDHGEAVSMLVQAKVILKQLPDEAFKSRNTSLSKQEWANWLDWGRRLRRTSENRPRLLSPARGPT